MCRSRPIGLVPLAVALVLATIVSGGAGRVVGQPPVPPQDLLRDAKSRQQVADQKAEAAVREAIALAQRLAATQPARAAQVLRTAQTDIDLSAAISPTARRQLTDLLQRTIAQIEGRPVPAPASAKAEPNSAAIRQERQKLYEKYLAEVKEVNEAIQRIARLQQNGQTAAAQQEIQELARRYPDNPAVVLLQEKDTLAQRVQESQTFARLQSERMVAVANDVLRSSLPPLRDVEFPKDWKQKTERRLQTVPLTEREKKIIEALDRSINVNWNNVMLEEALQELSNKLGENIFVDKRSLADLGLDLQRPVTLQANNVPVRTALRMLLASQGLTFVVKDETIQVVTIERARNMLVTRVYYLGDLVQGIGPFGGAPQWGTFLDFQQTLQNVQIIIQSIQSSVDPLFWRENGGPGTITFHYPSMSIIVRASTEVHAVLGGKMAGRR